MSAAGGKGVEGGGGGTLLPLEASGPRSIEQLVPGYVPPPEGAVIDVAAEARAARQLLDHLVRRQAVVEKMLLPMAAGLLKMQALSAKALLPFGYPDVEEQRAAGFTYDQLLSAGFTREHLRDMGWNKPSLIPFSLPNAKLLVSVGFAPKSLREEGWWPCDFVMPLNEHGYPEWGGRIEGSVASWRAANPTALVANFSGRWLDDNDFVHFRGIKALNISNCNEGAGHHPNVGRPGVTDAAFANLVGIHTLDISGRINKISDSAFTHFFGIHTLYMNGRSEITDAAFPFLKGIHTLNMAGCSQPAITGAAFANLVGIHTLNISFCEQGTITDPDFSFLAGIHTLIMKSPPQQYSFYSAAAHITAAAFSNLAGIHTLDLSARPNINYSSAVFGSLVGIVNLTPSDGRTITYTYPTVPPSDTGGEFVMPLDAQGRPDFGPLIRGPLVLWRAANPTALVANMGQDTRYTGSNLITDHLEDSDFVYFRGIRALNISRCMRITDAAFSSLTGIQILDISHCAQLSDGALTHLQGLKLLCMDSDRYHHFTEAGLAPLRTSGCEIKII